MDCWGSFIPMGNPNLRRMDFVLFKPSVKLGRDPLHNHFMYSSKYVSNEHLAIEWSGDGNILIRDLSSNGTWVDGVQLQKDEYRSLRDGQEVSFGREGREYVYTFRLGDVVRTQSAYEADYDVICPIGQGGFGQVKKALNKKTGRFVAIKEIKLNKRSFERDSLSREIGILKGAQHPHIVVFEKAYSEYNKMSVVLEYVDGGDLHEYVDSTSDVVDEPMAQHLMYQLCDALYYLHSCNVAHRDLKPSNILLTNETPPFVKLADFGLAKVVNSSATMFKSTFLGTRAYMAPEVYNKEAPYTPLVDSWSVGIIIFYLFTKNHLVPNNHPSNPCSETLSMLRDYLYIQTYTPCILDSFDERYSRLSAPARHFLRQLIQVDHEQRMPITGTMVHRWFQGFQPVYTWNDDKERVKQRDLLPLNQGNEYVCLPFARRTIVDPEGGFFEEANRKLGGDLAERLRAMEERYYADKAQS